MRRERTSEEIAQRKAKKERKKAEKRKAVEAAANTSNSKKRKKQKAAANPAQSTLSEDDVTRVVDEAMRGFERGIRLASMLNPAMLGYQPALKEAWSSLPADRRAMLVQRDTEVVKEKSAGPSAYPFHTEPSDHCETSPKAYSDVQPFLELLAERLGKAHEKLRVWDPYYCTGSVKKHLGALGFTKVHNECEDFYKILQSGELPRHHVVVTNPPYSEPSDGEPAHAARLLRFLHEHGKPYIINMPEYCASAAYYRELFAKKVEDAGEHQRDVADRPLFLCPYKRYHFWSPIELAAAKNPKAHRRKELGFRNSPFVSFWYVNLAPVVGRKELLSLVSQGEVRGVDTMKNPSDVANARLCGTLTQLPDGRDKFKTSATQRRAAKTEERGQKLNTAKKLAAKPAHPSGMTSKERRKLNRAHLQWNPADSGKPGD